MMLFRSAVKQICRRHGYHASFMCRPKLPNVMSSGWHLHQSLRDRKTAPMRSSRMTTAAVAARPAFPRRAARACARGGGVHHADHQRLQALSRLFAGARPRDLGPRQSRRDGAGARAARRCGDASGEPHRRAGGQSLSLHGLADRHAGLDGIARKLDPGPSADTPYETQAPLLPKIARRGARRVARRRRASAKVSARAFIDYYRAHQGSAEFDALPKEAPDASRK